MVTGLIVLEGCDGSGKTTLANYFVKKYGAVHIHQSYRYADKMFTYHTAVLDRAVRLSASKLVVLDRLWASEDIYGCVYRGGTRWPQEGRMVDRVLLKHGALQIFCLCDPATYADRLKKLANERAELYVSKAEAIAKEYWSLYHGEPEPETSFPRLVTYASDLRSAGGLKRRHDCMRYRIDFEGTDLARFAESALDLLLDIRTSQLLWLLDPNHPGVTGTVATATAIIVGDEVNSKSHRISWPFYDYGRSSLTLAEAMHAVGADETKYLYTNANSEDGKRLLREVKLPVVCLGQEAHKTLTKLGIPHETTYHPQFVRRFCKDLISPRDYGESIVGAAHKAQLNPCN